MLDTMSWLLLKFVFIFLLNGVTCQQVTADDQLRTYFAEHVEFFHGQARKNETRVDRQFATLTFHGAEGPNNSRYRMLSHDNNGNNIVKSAATDSTQLCYPPPESAVNYIHFRPEGERQAANHAMYSMQALLKKCNVHKMWNNYRYVHNTTPDTVILFYCGFPCNDPGYGHNCLQQIVDAFHAEPLVNARRRILAYNGRARSQNPSTNIANLFANSGIEVYPALFLPSTMTPRRNRRSQEVRYRNSSDQFDQCLINCYDYNAIAACVPDTRRKEAAETFVVQLVAHLSSIYAFDVSKYSPFELKRTNEDAVKWIRQKVDVNCRGLTYRLLDKQTSTCFDRCQQYLAQQYESPFTEKSDVIEMQKQIDQSWALLCRGERLEGVLCSRFRNGTVSAGGYITNGQTCSRNGTMYSWVRIDGNNWDYCCETPCENGRCVVGDGRSAYCGSPGYLTIHGQPCRSGFACGLHGKSYYWCYTNENNDWDYCCWSKTEECSLQRNGYDECDVARKGTYNMQQCGGKTSVTINGKQCRPGHPCSTYSNSYYYWCYTNLSDEWDYCCSRNSKCDNHGGGNISWCHVYGDLNYGYGRGYWPGWIASPHICIRPLALAGQ